MNVAIYWFLTLDVDVDGRVLFIIVILWRFYFKKNFFSSANRIEVICYRNKNLRTIISHLKCATVHVIHLIHDLFVKLNRIKFLGNHHQPIVNSFV